MITDLDNVTVGQVRDFMSRTEDVHILRGLAKLEEAVRDENEYLRAEAVDELFVRLVLVQGIGL